MMGQQRGGVCGMSSMLGETAQVDRADALVVGVAYRCSAQVHSFFAFLPVLVAQAGDT